MICIMNYLEKVAINSKLTYRLHGEKGEISMNITKEGVNGKLAHLSDLTGLNFRALYHNGLCHIVYDLPKGEVEGVSCGTKREMYDFAYAMIMGVKLYEKFRKN